MIRVAVEVLPYGNIEEKRKIAQVDIANVSKEFAHRQDYVYSIQEWRKNATIDAKGIIKGHDRSAFALMLVRKVLNSINNEGELTEEQLDIIEQIRSIGEEDLGDNCFAEVLRDDVARDKNDI